MSASGDVCLPLSFSVNRNYFVMNLGIRTHHPIVFYANKFSDALPDIHVGQSE